VIFPYSLMATMVFGTLASFGTIPMMAVGGVLLNNTVEYGEWKTGKRIVGMTNSICSFGAKVGGGIGSGLIGWMLALGHYDGMLPVQPHSAILSIFAICIWLPGLALLILYFLLRLYDLDKTYPQIIKDLEERRRAAV